jgi:hypothetical protein
MMTLPDQPILSGEEVALALAQLGEDVTVERIEAVRGRINANALPTTDRDAAVLKAVDAERQREVAYELYRAACDSASQPAQSYATWSLAHPTKMLNAAESSAPEGREGQAEERSPLVTSITVQGSLCRDMGPEQPGAGYFTSPSWIAVAMPAPLTLKEAMEAAQVAWADARQKSGLDDPYGDTFDGQFSPHRIVLKDGTGTTIQRFDGQAWERDFAPPNEWQTLFDQVDKLEEAYRDHVNTAEGHRRMAVDLRDRLAISRAHYGIREAASTPEVASAKQTEALKTTEPQPEIETPDVAVLLEKAIDCGLLPAEAVFDARMHEALDSFVRWVQTPASLAVDVPRDHGGAPAIDASQTDQEKGVVLYSERDGVFLGDLIGLSFWSKLDPAGQTHAATFASEAQALAYVSTWDSKPADIRCVGVMQDGDRCASIAACVAAGLPAWDPADVGAERTLRLEIEGIDQFLRSRGFKAEVVPGAVPGEPACIVRLSNGEILGNDTAPESLAAAAQLWALLHDTREGIIAEGEFETFGGGRCREILKSQIDQQQAENLGQADSPEL